MFIENNHNKISKIGWIEVICGSMFSGKTEELIRRIRRAEFAQQQVRIFKPKMDSRYDKDKVVSHKGDSISSVPIKFATEVFDFLSDEKVVAFDEAQFFGQEITAVCRQLVMQGRRVIISGLDMDYRQEPFGPMPELMAMAKFVSKVHAICMECGELAQYSYRFDKDQNRVLLGEMNAYRALCGDCYHRFQCVEIKEQS